MVTHCPECGSLLVAQDEYVRAARTRSRVRPLPEDDAHK